jgi:hypothetical protein
MDIKNLNDMKKILFIIGLFIGLNVFGQTTVLLKRDSKGSCFKVGNLNYQDMGIKKTSVTVYTYIDYYYLRNDITSYVSKSDYIFDGQITDFNVAYDSLLNHYSTFKNAELRNLETLPMFTDTIWQAIIPYPGDTSIKRLAGVAPKDLILNPLAKTAIINMYINNIGHPELNHSISFQIDITDSIQGVPTYNYFDGARVTFNWDWPTTVKYGIQYCPREKFDDR